MKRHRSESKGPVSARRRAAAIGARMNARYPYSSYGRMYVKRGTPENVARFGATYKEATPEQRITRRGHGYYGRGGYWAQKLGAKPGGFWDKMADTITPMIPGGSEIAAGTRALHEAMTGRGLYVGQGKYTAANDLVHGADEPFEAPRFARSMGGQDGMAGITITNREFVRNIYAPSAASVFQVQTLTVNPGLEATFPWLSQLAINFEEYELKQLIFSYRSTVTDFNSGTGQSGTVLLASQYNVDENPFSDEVTMLSYAGACSAKATEHQLQGVECDPAKLSGSVGKYVRNQNLKPSDDYKDYDHAILNIGVSNIPSQFINQQIGQLWVSYTVELRKPKLTSAKGFAIPRFYYTLPGYSTVSGYGERPTISPFALAGTNDQIRSFGLFGAQNSIPIQLSADASPGANGAVFLTFPAWYSGNVEIKAYCTFRAGGNQQFAQVIALAHAGNVAPINDVPVLNGMPGVNVGTTKWDNQWADYDNDPDMPGNVLTVANASSSVSHFRIRPSTNGVDNVVRLFLLVPTGFLMPSAVTSFTLDVMEYNQSLCFKTDGTNDRIALVNWDGDQRSIPS